MEHIAIVVELFREADPVVLVALISVVAMLVVADCVRQICKAISNKGDK